MITAVSILIFFFNFSGILNNQTLIDDLEENWEFAFPFSFGYDHLPQEDQLELNNLIRNYYFQDRKFGDVKENITKVM